MEVKSQLYSMLSSDIDLSIVDSVLSRLESFGYTPVESDVFSIGFSIIKSISSIKNFCSIIYIPTELYPTLIDISCAEILLFLKASGKISADNLSALSIGDTSYTFDSSSADSSVESFISHLFNSGEVDLLCFRRLRW